MASRPADVRPPCVVTPNPDFYRIDTALVVPSVDPPTWKLRIHGMVAQEVTLTWDELLALPLVELARDRTRLKAELDRIGALSA